MRKVILFFMIIIMTTGLSSCGLIVPEEDSEAYVSLKEQFNAYHENDFMFTNRFHEFVNQASLNVSKSVVKIKVDIIHEDGYTLVSRYGSGSIFMEDEQKYYIITANDLLNTSDQQTIRLQITDYKGNLYTGQLIHKDIDYELGVISININTLSPLPLITFSDVSPLPQEPILLISYRGQTINSMAMGFVVYTFDGDPLHPIYTTIQSDIFGNGGAIFNNRLEVVGIQFMVEINESVGINVKGIQLYLDMFNQFFNQT
ncbi:MAG: serine protease [Bacillota bacterium]|nr:MAG: serine protease [Bacillota bacterium]